MERLSLPVELIPQQEAKTNSNLKKIEEDILSLNLKNRTDIYIYYCVAQQPNSGPRPPHCLCSHTTQNANHVLWSRADALSFIVEFYSIYCEL
jgi:hypothetical protein